MRGRDFHLGRYRLRIAWLPAVAALAVLGLMLWAGFWQLERAAEKRRILVEESYRASRPPLALDAGLLGRADLSRLRHRRAIATGHYRTDRQYLLDNRTHQGVAGYHVLTPLRLDGGDVHVLVNRGWIAIGPDRARLPDIAVTPEAVSVEGVVAALPASGLALGPAGYADGGWPRVVQRVDVARIEAQIGAPLLPFVLRLSADSDHGFVREWQAHTGLTPERHIGYAVQWFAMAAALLALCLFVSLRRLGENAHER